MGLFLRPRYRRTSGESNDTTWSLTSGGPSKRRQRARLLEQATKPLDLSRGAVAYAENLLACVQRTTAPYSLEPHNIPGGTSTMTTHHISRTDQPRIIPPLRGDQGWGTRRMTTSHRRTRPRKSDETYNLYTPTYVQQRPIWLLPHAVTRIRPIIRAGMAKEAKNE